MKKQRPEQVMWMLMLTGFLYAGSAVAAPQWYTCDVDAIGTKDRTGVGKPPLVIVTLDDTDAAFTDKEFRFPDKSRKEMMATVLTAITNGFQVEILTNLDSAGRPLITNIHVLKSP